MAIQVLNNAQLIVGTFDVSAFTGQIDSTPGMVAVTETTNFGSGGFACYVPSIKAGTVGLTGFTDHAATGIATAFPPSTLGTQYAYSAVMPQAGSGVAATGDPCVFGTGKLTKWSPVMVSPDKAAGFKMELVTDDDFANGKVGAPLGSRTTSGYTGAAVALTGPSASQFVYGILHVTAASGTNLAVKIQSDDNSGFTSPTDRLTFTTVSATGWQFATPLAGNLSTETYWRAIATIATGTFTFACYFGVA